MAARELMMRQVTARLGDKTKVAWIPAKLAKVGAFVRFGSEDGWEIISASRPRKASEVEERSRDFRRTRLVSDI